MKNIRFKTFLSHMDDVTPAKIARVDTCFSILSLARAIDGDCERRLQPYQLSEAKFVLLLHLSRNNDGLSPHKLADDIGVTRATMTGLLDGLERQGFVMRLADMQDRRKYVVYLSEHGQKIVEELSQTHANWIGSLLDGLSNEEQKTLKELCLKVWKNTDEAKGGCIRYRFPMSRKHA